ncbi:MFS transporter [Pseudonocardia sp. NPDC049154]|uniref:MFS transporter n=1 Tax=Pseudonocardia sp. NPDC049154 TaxID=3155501 RepID=UPI0033DED7DD
MTVSDPAGAHAQPQPSSSGGQRRLAYTSSLLGSAIEYYDFLIYSTAAALVFGPVFFPSEDSGIGVVSSFSTLAVGYVARPLGGLLFGHWGDRVGRKSALITTLVAMSVATVLIGVLPSHAVAGPFGAIALVVLRLVQGVAVGGEWGGSVLITVEHATPRRRGFLGSATSLGATVGIIVSTGAFAALNGLDQADFLSWGWRIPFLATVALLALGLVMRLRLEESPAMVAARRDGTTVRRLSIIEVFQTMPGRTVLAIGVFLGPFAVQAIMTTFAVTYAVTTVAAPRQLYLNAILAMGFVQLATIPLFGWLSDRCGRKPVYVTAVVLMLASVALLFPTISAGGAGLVVTLYIVHLGVLHGAAIAVVPTLLAEVFPVAIRYTGISVAYQGAAVVGGGLFPLAAASLATGAAAAAWITVLMLAGVVVSSVCALLVQPGRVDRPSVGADGGDRRVAKADGVQA